MIQTLAFAVLLSAGIVGQRGASPAPTNQPQQPPSPTRGTNQPTTPQPNAPTNPDTTTTPDNTRPIFISGSVKLSDGTPAPPNVSIHILCGITSIRTNTYADPGGNFSIILNNQRETGFTD